MEVTQTFARCGVDLVEASHMVLFGGYREGSITREAEWVM
jgi:hypothetical protein